MHSIAKCLFATFPLKNTVYYATFARSPKRYSKKRVEHKKTKGPRGPNYFTPNPGVQHQITAMGMTEQELRSPDNLENMEQQFWNTDKVHDEIEREEHISKELLEIFQIQRKQFKEEKSPNLLFWDEKQEIKALHSKDPEKWTVMRLAFSYPATPSIIKKVLKANWKLRTQEDIERHDQKIRGNWEALSKGKLHVPNKSLKEHLMSFSNRSNIPQTTSKEISTIRSTIKDHNPLDDMLKDGGVFGNIYKSYKETMKNTSSASSTKEEKEETLRKKEEKESLIEAALKVLHHPPDHDTFIIPRSVQKIQLRTTEPATLKAMKERVMAHAQRGKRLGEEEMSFIQGHPCQETGKSFYNQVKDPIGVIPLTENHGLKVSENYSSVDSSHIREDVETVGDHVSTDESGKDFQSAEDKYKKFMDLSQVYDYKPKEDLELKASLKTAKKERSKEDNETIFKAVKDYVKNSTDSYPLEIEIPKDLWQKGKLYRVKDRFYSDDGEFLYRVPGLCKE